MEVERNHSMKKIVIIGAGPAGLTAAYELLKRDKSYQVILLEEEKEVGGISKTVSHNGNHMDIGGHRFFTKEERVEAIWKEVMPFQEMENAFQKDKRDKVFLIRNRVSRIFYENKFYDYPVSINMKTILNLGIVRTFTCGFSYLKASLFKKKEKNLEDFYENRFGKKLYSIFFQGYTEKVWGRSPKKISKEWGEQRVKGISILACIKDNIIRLFHLKNKNQETSLITRFYYPKHGPGEFYNELAKKVEELGGVIYKNTKVVKFHKKKQKIYSVIYLEDGLEKELAADIFISSMPIKDLIEGFHEVPKKVREVAIHLPYRAFVTVGVLVSSLSLKKGKDGKVPDCWLYIQDDSVKLGRVQIFNNWSPYMVKDTEHTFFLGLEYFCDEEDEYFKMSDEEWRDLAKEELKKTGISDSPILDYHVLRVKKAYPAYFDSYTNFDIVKKYLNSITNLYCIGRNGQHRYNNMDHSMMTAIKCVDVILDPSLKKEDIWNVNTDSNYHEVKHVKEN